jgi:hypothetical protein
MKLDSYTSPESIEARSSRLGCRYDQQALELLADFREGLRQSEASIDGFLVVVHISHAFFWFSLEVKWK